MPSTILRRIASHYLLTPQGFYSCPLITVDSTNRQTVKIEKYDNSLDFKEGVEFYSGIICQGFVNAHCHSELSYLHGAIPTQCGYASFASEMAAVRNNYTEQQRLAAIMQADSCMWQEGIDAVADIVNDNSSFAVKQQSAIFYHSFAEVFGLKKSNIELCNSLVNNPNTTLTPHSVYSVQESDFKSVEMFDYMLRSASGLYTPKGMAKSYSKLDKVKKLFESKSLAELTKEEYEERKALLAEKKETPYYQIPKLHDLTRHITELTEEFFHGLTRRAGLTLHIRQLAGANSHHIVEGAFKSVARSLKAAVALDEKNPDAIPSTKGVL